MTRRPLGLHSTVLLLAGTHFVVDGYTNIYAPLLPLLIPRLELSLAAAGVLQMCFLVANSVAQLGFGYVADRWRPRVLLVAGPVLAVSLLSLVGLATSPVLLGVILVAGGFGAAAFHPPAAALAHRFGGTRQGLAMSVHITGGSLGFSLGPLLFAPVAERYGLPWTPLFAVPALVLLALALRRIPPIRHLGAHGEPSGFRALARYRRPLVLLYLVVVFRTLAALSFSTFMPVMLTRQGMSVSEAGVAMAVYLFASSVGGFLGGPLADRWGPRTVILWSLVCSVPFLALAPTQAGWTLVSIASVGGFLLQSTLPVNVTFAHMVAPVSAATVSSLMMGFAWGTGGISVPFVGMLADGIGIEAALTCMALLPLVAAVCAVPLPASAAAYTPSSTSATDEVRRSRENVAP